MPERKDRDSFDKDRSTSGVPKAGGKMTVEEAGHMGGQRVRELVEEGKEKEKGGKK